MRFAGIHIGFALTGSHCTIPDVLPYLQQLQEEGAELTPIFSAAVLTTDTRFGKAKELYQKVVAITGKEPLTTIVEAEPIGPQNKLDLVVVAPCTGNTLAKLAQGITDSSVTMACKAQLRNNKPVVLAVATNDGLSGNARNLGILLNRRNVYFVPFGQDAPHTKQTSLNAKMSLIPETILEALRQRQIQPVLIPLQD
ncbi:dipicolinate synthase subunit B [Hydrogenispora ethanolica]|uniref:Dipicolinate synthase subunit B n=1 Tax=Hydrogenispora ethanolica TaxID=1082276 RepID=A0A4V2QCV3_HYDET|nr:dipicolinate synthase subunit B [Hydrogenispora ethanolica]TCL61797.1 dipicolinate synthase subunit B [Hydrogenispora ethanolica]